MAFVEINLVKIFRNLFHRTTKLQKKWENKESKSVKVAEYYLAFLFLFHLHRIARTKSLSDYFFEKVDKLRNNL